MGVDPASVAAETAVASDAAAKGGETAAALAPAAAGAGEAAAASAPLDLLAGGAAAGTAVPGAVGTIEGIGDLSGLATGLATEPGFASSAAGTFAPGLDTGLGAGVPLAGLNPPGSSAGPSPTGGVPAAAAAGAAPSAGPISSFSPFSGGSPAAPGVQGSPLGYAGSAAPGDPTDFTTIGPGSGSAGAGPSAGPLDIAPAAAAAARPPHLPRQLPGVGSSLLSGLTKVAPYAALAIGGQLASPAITKALGLDKVPGSQNLTNLAQESDQLAQQQQAYGSTLEQPLVTGVLPPGQQQAVTNALNDATATIKARYGALGLSGSSMEAEAIANAQNQSVALQGQIEQEMAQTGASAVSSATQNLGLEDSIYQSIMSATIGQDQALGNAISKFATAAGTGAGIASVAKSAQSA